MATMYLSVRESLDPRQSGGYDLDALNVQA